MILLAIIIDIFLILISLKYAWWYPSINTNKTRIMMYHMISNQIIGSKKSGLRVSEEMFEKHLRYFVKNNWKFIKMSDLNKYAYLLRSDIFMNFQLFLTKYLKCFSNISSDTLNPDFLLPII